MANGLDIDIDQFKKMGKNERDILMYKNIVYIRGNVRSDKLNRKMQYIWLIALTGILGVKRIFGLG